MKLKTFTILLLLISGSAFSQSKEKIQLEWKIAKNDTLKYKTTMNAIRVESGNVEMDSTSLFSGVEFQNLFKSLNDINAGIKYQTNLFLNNRDPKLIDIEMIMITDGNDAPEDFTDRLSESKSDRANETKKEKRKRKRDKVDKSKTEPDSLSFKNLFKSLIGQNNNVVLRGRISNTGEIISSYYKNAQKNLIAVLFELPNKTVQVGEEWKVNVNLIEMDQGFFADSLSKVNSVYIDKIIDVEGDRIAVIKYNISEYVSGDFNSLFEKTSATGTGKKSFMKMSHTATGNFSITKGKWISYKGEMEVENDISILGGKTKTIFELVE